RGQELEQELEAVGRQLGREKTDTGQVAGWPREARNETDADRVITGHEDNGDGRRCRFDREYGRRSGRSDHGNLAANEIGGQFRQSINLILGPAVYDCHVLALDVAALFQALAKFTQSARHRLLRSAVKEPNHRHCRLLCGRRERPRRRCAADERDELAAPHSITSSARASSDGGTSSASALAVLRLITSSNFVGS